MKYCPDCGDKLSTRIIDEVERRVCIKNGCNYTFWNNPIPVVAALVHFNDKYIIARNANWPPGRYSVISGYLECAEDPEIAVLREVKEELGLDGVVTSYLGHHIFAEQNQLILAFEVLAKGSVLTNDELVEIKYLTQEALLDYNFKPFYITEKIINEWSKLK